ncbi:MAG: CtsR family transcriptional regulator [Clostridia bacterium]|nr:CtsR family transcriptional regulator [Clostridia bacterium]
MVRLSDMIEQFIQQLISEGGTAEIQRNELASRIGCVPSQINYVITSRFTPEQGYIVESRRGGGGYIRIQRVQLDRGQMLMHIVNSIGPSIDAESARVFIANLCGSGMISKEAACLMSAAAADKAYLNEPPKVKSMLRAAIFKQMLLSLLK